MFEAARCVWQESVNRGRGGNQTYPGLDQEGSIREGFWSFFPVWWEASCRVFSMKLTDPDLCLNKHVNIVTINIAIPKIPLNHKYIGQWILQVNALWLHYPNKAIDAVLQPLLPLHIILSSKSYDSLGIHHHVLVCPNLLWMLLDLCLTFFT